MPRSGVAFAFVLLLLSACGTPSGSDGPVRPGEPGRTVEGKAPAPRGAGEPARLSLTARGIRQLPATTPMTREALSRALAGFTVELVPEDEYTEEHFAVKAGEERVLELRFSGDEANRKLSFVDVVSAKVETDLGVAVGSTHAEVKKALGKLTCSDGGEESDSREALVVCTSAGRKNLVFEFIDADEDGTPRRPASEVLEDKAGLDATTLVTITWAAEVAARRPAELSPEARARLRDALRRGRALAKKGQHAAAARAFAEALAAAPGDARAASELGWAAFRAGDMGQARKATLESIAGAAEPAVRAASLYNLGRIEEAAGQKERAAQAYRDSLALRPNATVRARLVAVAPETPADEALVVLPLDGPYPSLAAWCAAWMAANPDDACSPEQVMFEVETGRLRAKGAWRAVRVLQVGPFESCALAVRTRGGWFVERWIAECREMGGRWDRLVSPDEIAIRDVLPGGGPELILRLTSEMVSNITDSEAEPSAQVLQESSERLYLLCGIGASGDPSCLPTLTVGYDVSFSAEPEGTATPRPAAWSLAVTSFADGIELRAERGASSMSAEAAKLLGRHRFAFP